MDSFLQTLWAAEAKTVFFVSVIGIAAAFVLFVRWAEKEQNKMLLGGSFVLAFFALYAFLFLFPHPGKDQSGLVIGNLSEIVAATVGLMVTAAASLYAIRIAQAAKRLAEEDRRQSEQERVERFLDKAYVTNATIQNQLNAAHFEAINLPRLYHNDRLVFLLDYFRSESSVEGYFDLRSYIDVFISSTDPESALYAYGDDKSLIMYEHVFRDMDYFKNHPDLKKAAFLDEAQKLEVAAQYEKAAQSLIDLLEPAVTSYEHRALLFNDATNESYSPEKLTELISHLRTARSAIKPAISRDSFAVEQAVIDWTLRLYKPSPKNFYLRDRNGTNKFIVFLATLSLATLPIEETETTYWPRIEKALRKASETIYILTMAAKDAKQFETFINAVFLGKPGDKGANKTLEELRFGPKGFQGLDTTGLLNTDLKYLREVATNGEASVYQSLFQTPESGNTDEKFLSNPALSLGKEKELNEQNMNTNFFLAINGLALNGRYFPLGLDGYHSDIKRVIKRISEKGLESEPGAGNDNEPSDVEIDGITKNNWDDAS